MSPSPNRAGALVRAAAAEVVARVITARVTADELLPVQRVAVRDQALLAALVFGALRWHERLEWQARRLLTRPLERDQAQLAALLRIGLLQLQELRIPPHAAVAATVDAAELLGLGRARGLVNAVLRRFQRERVTLLTAQASVPEAHFSHPGWLIAALREDYPAQWPQVLEANNAPAPLWLRVNLARTTRAEYLAELETKGVAAVAADEVPSAIRLETPVPVAELPGFAAGRVSVQDIAAQRAAGLLDVSPGQRILDACAAPGGKTGHLLEVLGGRGDVWALDRDPVRLALVADNLARLDFAAKLVCGDAGEPGQWWDGKPFDRILLDAPCSAVGVIRRHPDIKLLRRPADVVAVEVLQTKLLHGLWPLLAPGGRFVYATCTVLKRENEAQLKAFCDTEPSVRFEGQRQLLPGETQGDGFYYAWLHKAHVPRTSSGSNSPA